jgi:hypothetical protein
MRRWVACTIVCTLQWCALPSVRAQEPSVADVSRRVGAYARRFISQFSNVVSEEEYEQRFTIASRKRHLKSDFLLVGYPGRQELVMVFRDVREVDGKPVRDKQDRITRLFLEPFNNAAKRAQEIHRDGLRLSIDNGRLMDPLTVMGYLQPEYQGGFRITLGEAAKDLGPDVRVMNLSPLPARERTTKPARAWVAESTGEVYKTELRSGFGARAEITTTAFATDPGLNIRVPLAMRDEVPRGSDDYIGTATYSRFRRFEVRTDAEVEVPDPAKPR